LNRRPPIQSGITTLASTTDSAFFDAKLMQNQIK